jgi:hypothetical protein
LNRADLEELYERIGLDAAHRLAQVKHDNAMARFNRIVPRRRGPDEGDDGGGSRVREPRRPIGPSRGPGDALAPPET